MGGSSSTVFVVEDNDWVRLALRRVLEGTGFAVQAYADGRAFLAAVGPDTVGCAVIDQAMPGMTGLQVLEQMQQAGLRMPSILLTGSGSRAMERKAKGLGAFMYLDKPVEGERLLEAVRLALGSIGSASDGGVRTRP